MTRVSPVSHSERPSTLAVLPYWQQLLLAGVSLLLVTFGQPAWSWLGGLVAAVAGYALFWRVLLCHPQRSRRFWMAMVWFTTVQLVQLSWLTSHPFLYIYPLWIFFAAALGAQFGIFGLFIIPENLQRTSRLMALAGFWTLLEWIRLFFLSGYSWNPAGLALTGSLYPLQMASFWGVFGLSFWVMFVNLLTLRFWCWRRSRLIAVGWVIAVSVPYFYGLLHLQIHDAKQRTHPPSFFNAVLVQTVFPIEEHLDFADTKSVIAYVIDEWREILRITKKHRGKAIDLIVLPEYVVPGGTYSFLFPFELVRAAFRDVLGEDSLQTMPVLEEPVARTIQTAKGPLVLVNNAFWAQTLANYFNAGVVVGLEDAEDKPSGKREFYSAALYFRPEEGRRSSTGFAERYEKRVLVPLGEYIPFDFCRALAASYGVQGSFTPGKSAKVFKTEKAPFGLSICYEETFGNLMRENKLQGAAVLVNLTSDVWYPNSRLPIQHFAHARLRTVESGIPLIRASNLGVTGAVDSLGRVIAFAGEGTDKPEWQSDSIYLHIPLHTYHTLYTYVGDALIIGISLLAIVLCFRLRRESKR